MKRSFTLFATVLSFVAISGKSFSQCLTGGTFTASTDNPFNTNNEGFSGDFSWSANGSGQMESSGVDMGTSKVLTSSTFFLPATETALAWSYDLGGNANVASYGVYVKYSQGGIVQTLDLCSGGALITNSGPHVFAAVAPAQIIGKDFQLEVIFHSTSSGSKNLTVDNFKTSAFNSAIMLPVNITYFGVAVDSGKVKLTWLVSAESNVNRYDIERSSNGKKTFVKVGQVLASALVTYTYLDSSFSNGTNYYRLKAVDNDGNFKYSSVVLYKAGKNGIALRAYPSPAKDDVIIQHDLPTRNSMIDIVTVEGKLVKTIKPAVGEVETTVNISSLKKGLYFVRYMNSDGETETLKLVKQ